VATLFTSNETLARQTAPLVWEAFTLGPTPPEPKSVIYETLGIDFH